MNAIYIVDYEANMKEKEQCKNIQNKSCKPLKMEGVYYYEKKKNEANGFDRTTT